MTLTKAIKPKNVKTNNMNKKECYMRVGVIPA